MNTPSPVKSSWYDRVPAPAFVALATLATFALSLCFFSPCWWLIASHSTGSYEWARATGYLAQCENPWRTDIEPALMWRLLPPGLCWLLGLRGVAALMLPVAGLVAMVATCVLIFLRAGLSRGATLRATLLIGLTTAFIVPAGWLGVNDAWVWLGLLCVAHGRTRASLIWPALLCPWVDERFVIGMPLALFVRLLLTTEAAGQGACIRFLVTRLLWLAPYAVIRLALMRIRAQGSTASFLEHSIGGDFITWVRLAPMGWWMAYRAAWLPIALASAALWTRRRTEALVGALLLGLTAFFTVALAADLSRSPAIILPVLTAAIVLLWRADASRLPRLLFWVVGANLVLPLAHVVYHSLRLIDSLPVELVRLLYRTGPAT